MNIILPIKSSDVEFYLNKDRVYVSIFANGSAENVCVEREIKKDELKNLIQTLEKYYNDLP